MDRPLSTNRSSVRDAVRKAWQSCVASVSGRRADGTPCRQLFDVVDGRMIIAAKQSWRVTVYAILDDGMSRWVQVKVSGKADLTVTLRLTAGADSKDVIRTLAAWLNNTTAEAPRADNVVSSLRCAC